MVTNKLSNKKFTEIINSNTSESAVCYSWVWNGKLEYDTIKRELNEFSRAGIKALYIIPEPKEFRPTSLKTYLEPPYMSEDYLQYYKFAVEYALNLGINVWLYDEGGWPSGGACGLTKKLYENCDPMYFSSREGIGTYSPNENSIAAFDKNGKRIFAGESANDGFTEYFSERKYCGVNFVDLTNKEVTDAFLKTTHDKYFDILGEYCNDKIKYMFTDEPKLTNNAWSHELPKLFKDRFGYDITDFMEQLENPTTEEGRRAKIDYKSFLGSIFNDNYLRICANWCHERGLQLCGHLDLDHILQGSPAGQYGSGLKLLRTFDLPGIDVIWQQIFPGRKVDGYSFFPKLASSAARQSGHEYALSESFAVYGDGITSDEMRYVINYQLWLGINIFNFMTLPYGREKALSINMRPMPTAEKPGFFSLEHIYKTTELLSALMANGERICDTALYLPSADISLGGEYARRAEESFTAIGEELGRLFTDFDIIDDEAVLNAKETQDGLKIGNATYRHIILPECEYIPKEVKAIAKKYQGRGEQLIKCSHPDIRVAARSSEGEKLYFLFNSGIEKADFNVNTDANMYLELQSGEFLNFDGHLTLESGEAAVLVKSNNISPKKFKEEYVSSTKLEKISNIKRFVLDEHEISSQIVDKITSPFSGEVTFEMSLSSSDCDLRLKFDLKGLKVSAYHGNVKIGDCGTIPQFIDVPKGINNISITISNNAVNEIHAKMPHLSNVWDKAEYISYNDKLTQFEHTTNIAENFAPTVSIYKLPG